MTFKSSLQEQKKVSKENYRGKQPKNKIKNNRLKRKLVTIKFRVEIENSRPMSRSGNVQ